MKLIYWKEISVKDGRNLWLHGNITGKENSYM
jgi:hypothetical protein